MTLESFGFVKSSSSAARTREGSELEIVDDQDVPVAKSVATMQDGPMGRKSTVVVA